MFHVSIVEFTDVSGKPKVKMDVPSPLRIGDVLHFAFRLRRQNGGRTEALEVLGKFRVTSVSFDATSGVSHQLLGVEAAGATPSWKAIKKSPEQKRSLPPTHFPRTIVE